jgi:3-phenylpropionate/cinnamic acid dioxygenase small subunit
LLSREKAQQTSHYLTDDLYARLAGMHAEAANLGPMADPAVQFEAEAFLFHEARLLDTRAFPAWLELFVDELIYWIPQDETSDPRTSVSLWLDDRRRLEDRLVRFGTGFAYNQIPHRRLRRVISNVEAWQAPDGRSRRVLSNQIIFEHRKGHPVQQHVAHVDHVLRLEDGRWRIAIKRALLINGLDGFEIPTLL